MTDTPLSVPAVAPSTSAPTPQFDVARLMRKHVLTGPEAAFYLGYTEDSYKRPYQAFWEFVKAHSFPHFHAGRALRFRRSDLDAFINRLPDAQLAARR